MNLSYLYSPSILYPHAQTILDGFENSTSINLDSVSSIDDSGIYIIELNNANKEISQKLVTMFKNKGASLIYFIVPKNHSLLFFQLTFLLGAKALITYNQDIEKTISKIKSDKEDFTQDSLERWLGKIKIETQNFILYNNNNLTYATQPLLSSFECSNSDVLQEKVLSKLNIEAFLKQESSKIIDLSDNPKVENKYIFKSVKASQTDTIIYIEKNTTTTTTTQPTFISSRVAFVELLKESMLQSDLSDKNFSLLTINISNIKTLLAENEIVKFEEILLDMLTFMESTIEDKLTFSQFENHFYVILLANTDFEKINHIAENFRTKVLNYITHKENNMLLDLFAYDLKDQEFSSALTILHEIENGDFKEDEKNACYIKHLTNPNNEVNAKTLLDDAYKNKLNLKILNIYNGLVINTGAKIVKITDDNVYITFESLQGVVLNIEKQTVLQSEHFFQDIHSQIKQINSTKKIAVLENFKFLKTNANARKYARVTTPIKIPIKVSADGLSVTGSILDLSIKSIAIRVKNVPRLPMIEPNNASIVFNLANKTAEDGYVQLKLNAKIILVTPVDKANYYKVICDLDQSSDHLDTISKYVYERQKELIVELKKMSKLN